MLFSDFSSYFFNLAVFTALAALLGIYVLQLNRRFGKKALYNVFLGLGLFALLTQLSYVYAPKRIFSNASHHMIEHLGFSFEKTISLVNDQHPEGALWDNKTGKLDLALTGENSFALSGEAFSEPVFMADSSGIFHLANPVATVPVARKLSIRLDDTLSLDFFVHPPDETGDAEAYSFAPKVHRKTYGPFRVRQENLRTGYSLAGLISESGADFPLVSQFVQILSGSWLVRDGFMPGETLDLTAIPLLFFPSQTLAREAASISIDGKPLEVNNPFRFDVPISYGNRESQRFYFGLWNTRTKVYKARCNDFKTASCGLYSIFPDKKQLKKLDREQESLFLTSSSGDVTDNELLAGFFYPLFEQDNNENHFSATIAYHEGNTRERMKFRVVGTDKDDLLNPNTRLYNAGDTIRIETSGAGHARNALFRITDLKQTNPLQFWHLAVFTLWLIVCIYISFYLTPQKALTKTEVIAYLLLIVLLTVRSILLWRVSTFPPLEGISAKIYQRLTGEPFLYFLNGVGATTAFFILVWIWKIRGNAILYHISRWQERHLPGWNRWLQYLPYPAALILRFIPGLARFGAVFAPMAAFFVTELVILYRAEQAGKSVIYSPGFRTLSLLNWTACFAYLALSDAGFSIVFMMASLLYWLLRLLVFPDYQYAGGNASPVRHLRFLLPFTLLLTVMFASPVLLSLLFRNAGTASMLLAGMLIVLAAWLLVRKVTLWEGKPRLTWIAGGVLLVFAARLLIAPGPIMKKIEGKAYIRYRAEVLFRSPDEIIRDESFRFSLGNDSKLLRAAQNQWIINHYYEKGNLSVNDYFRLLPSFDKGSPYMTQISDLVTVRYLIGEHSQFVILQMLFLMILLVLSAVSWDTPFNLFSKVRVQLLCALFMVGFFIWMAATNRMVFLGQDFPLLSLNSVLTLAFTFSILLAAIMLGQVANRDTDHPVRFNAFGSKIASRLVRGLLLVGTLLIFVRQYDMNTKRFDLDATAGQLQAAFVEINDLFADYQRQQADTASKTPVSIATLIDGFDRHIRDDKDSLFKTTFSRSAYEAYRTKLARQNSAENLIHLRRGADGIYAFAINKLYYNVYSPDVYEQAWMGNVLAADQARTVTLVNRDTKASHVLESNQYNSDLGRTLEAVKLAKMNLNQNLRLSVIPAGWTPDSIPAVILSKTNGTLRENRSGFLVKNGVNLLKSGDLDQAIVLHANDVVQFLPERSREVTSLQLRHQNKTYLAKNIWLNGRRQFYYPLREKFLWSYYFTNLVKSKYDNETVPGDHDVQSTIDSDMTDQVYDLAKTFFSAQTQAKLPTKERALDEEVKNARAFNLVVLDEAGRVRALCDFKMGDKVRLNPNRMQEFITSQEAGSLQTDPQLDRLTFGNRCLMRMDNGPASTFKPVMYGAVTSQYNFNWPQLKFGGIAGLEHDADSRKDYIIRRFGGKSGLQFTVPSSNVNVHDMEYYISRSTNTYNSMVVFLGSLNRQEIDQVYQYANGKSSNATFLSRTTDDIRNVFPVLNYNGESFYIDKFPNWKSTNSIMARGLWENFGLPTRSEHLLGDAGAHLQNLAWKLDSDGFDRSHSTYKLWSFPEPSHAFMIDRVDLHTAIVQLSTGAAPIYATPLKMAEMAGKLFSFNKSYKATVVEGKTDDYHPLTADGSWNGAASLTSFYSRHLFRAMNQTLISGTARQLVGATLLREFPDYYFYAKTGTISGNRHGGKRDKHLMLIISKNQLHDKDLSPEELKRNKFFVLYFSLYKQSFSGDDWGTGAPQLLQEVARTVIKSPVFKSHML